MAINQPLTLTGELQLGTPHGRGGGANTGAFAVADEHWKPPVEE
jgi:hypothetical protein